MSLKQISIRVDPEVWDLMTDKAKQTGHSKNTLTNLVLKRVTQMSKEELLHLIYTFKGSGPSQPV